jgi:antitoxin component HigA of HigAB toxin-antitoxin module
MKGLTKFRNELLANQKSLDVQQETFRNVVTGQINMVMQTDGITKKELADRLGVSKPAVSGVLSGDRNLTIDKVSEVSFHLDCMPEFRLVRNRDKYRKRLTSAWIYLESRETHLQVFDTVTKKRIDMHKKRTRILASFGKTFDGRHQSESYVDQEA